MNVLPTSVPCSMCGQATFDVIDLGEGDLVCVECAEGIIAT